MNINDFKLTNELLHKVLGGNQSAPRFYSFSGANAVEQANNVSISDASCACGCGCSGGAGNGGGSGN